MITAGIELVTGAVVVAAVAAAVEIGCLASTASFLLHKSFARQRPKCQYLTEIFGQ